MESINILLCDYFGLTVEERKWKCNTCKTTILPVSTIGIKKLFLDILKIDSNKFQKIRDARNDLIHGRNPLNMDFIKEIIEYNPLVKEALITGIGNLLQIENKIISKIIKYKSIKYIENFRIILKLNLIELEIPKLEEVDNQPRVDLDYNSMKPLINSEGELEIKGKIMFNYHNLQFDKGSYEVKVDDFSTILKAKINFNS